MLAVQTQISLTPFWGKYRILGSHNVYLCYGKEDGMSFSYEQKKAVIAQSFKSSCCRRALLFGALCAKGYTLEDQICISVERIEVAEFFGRLISEFFGSKPQISFSEIGGRRVVIKFNSNSALKYIGNLNISSLFIKKCESCLGAFLRGLFIASGRMTDPKLQYSLEFSLGNRCELISEFLSELGLTPRISDKPSERVLYFKNSTDIEDFCAMAGLNRALFTLMDAKVEGEIRKNAMRVANCETNNITRAVNAAKPQLAVINALCEAGLLSSLPEELEQTARLRLEYPDYSLAQLAAVAVPAISKPGLSHRLKKLCELGESILRKHEEKQNGKEA